MRIQNIVLCIERKYLGKRIIVQGTLRHAPCDQSTLNSFRSLYRLYSTFD